jgi:uncharacterized Fe-S cluster-containing radical SAM superfamily protein
MRAALSVAPEPAATKSIPEGKFAGKFADPARTATGERRATVALRALRTLWFNTGTPCNIACAHCYIESSPHNRRLAWLTTDDVTLYLDEIARDRLPVEEIGFTGGEPFLNRRLPAMLRDCLSRGFSVLVLTNGMLPMMRRREEIRTLDAAFPGRLTIRVSIDHPSSTLHDRERGAGGFAKTLDGLIWLARAGIPLHVAGRREFGGTEAEIREGFARLFAEHDIPIDANDPVALTLFPEMDGKDVPEITESCWGILGRSPDSVMCASARMVARRQDADAPVVLACTLLAYDSRFELGRTLAEASRPVALNHPHCARFCVLGGAACSRPSR